MTALIRTSLLQGYESLARSLGLEPAGECQRAGIPLHALKNPLSFVPFRGFIQLLEHAASASACPTFGLLLAQRQSTAGKAEPLSVLMRHAQTLQDAFESGAHYLFLLSPAFQFSIAPVAGDKAHVDLSLDIDVPRLRSRTQIIDHGLCYIAHLVRMVSGGRVRPVLAMVPHHRLAANQRYTSALECECRFGTATAAIRITSKDLATKLPGRDPLLYQMARSYIEQHFVAPEVLFAGQVRQVVRRLLGTDAVTLAAVAQALAVHPKSLQRRLQAEGCRFGELLDSVRRERFVELSADHQALNLAQIALMLGYSEQSALTRSCTRWFGHSPTARRANARNAAPVPTALR